MVVDVSDNDVGDGVDVGFGGSLSNQFTLPKPPK